MNNAIRILATVAVFLVIINMILFGLTLVRNAFVGEGPTNQFDWLPFRKRHEAFPWTWQPNETESIGGAWPPRP